MKSFSLLSISALAAFILLLILILSQLVPHSHQSQTNFNLPSKLQVYHLDFMDTVREKVQQASFPISALMFEITETQIMRNPDQATVTLKQLKNLGVSIAIDDFGTGHSSLAYLKRLPIDKLKIDQSFVKDIPLDKENVELVKAIINIAKSLSLSVIAEGVETQDQAEMLLKNGCLQAQGYLYAKPLNKSELEAFLKLLGFA